MADDYLDMGSGPTEDADNPMSMTPPSESEATPEETEEDEGSSFTVGKEALGDVKIGDTITVKVTRIYDDEVGLKIERGGESKSKQSRLSMDDDELEAMAAEKA